jgi:hypothetical protein
MKRFLQKRLWRDFTVYSEFWSDNFHRESAIHAIFTNYTRVLMLFLLFLFLEPYSQYDVSLNAITSEGNGEIVKKENRTRESSKLFSFFTFPLWVWKLRIDIGIQLYLKNARRTSFDVSSEQPSSDLIRRRSRTSSDEGVGPHPTKDLRSKRRGSPCILALTVMDLAVLKKMTFLRYCIQHANWSHFGKIYWNWETWKDNLMERETSQCAVR